MINRLFNVNLKAVINVSQIIAKQMIANNIHGSIVNVSSQVQELHHYCKLFEIIKTKSKFTLQASQAPLKDHTVYCGTKAALDMVSKVMALELGPHKVVNIRYNVISL